jgi:hypothetical protein
LFKARQEWKGYFWFYVSDIDNINTIYWEISSSGTHTGNCVRYLIGENAGKEKLTSGWNKIEFILHDSSNLTDNWNDEYSKSFSDNYSYYLGGGMTGNVDWQHINCIRLIVSPKDNTNGISYYVNAMTIYDPQNEEITKKQIWVDITEDDKLSYDSTSYIKPTVSWTPNDKQEGTHSINVTINDYTGSQVLMYRKLENSPLKLKKFSMVIRLTNAQHTTAGAFHLTTLNDSTTQILCSTESISASQFVVVRFEGVLENWWKCYGMAGAGNSTYNRYNTLGTKYWSYPLGTRTMNVMQSPIELLQLGFGSENGALPAGTNIELWGIE